MIHLDVVQGSVAWLNAKVGVPSASNFHRIITPRTGKPSASADGYAYELLAEELLGRPLDDETTAFMQRGTLLEEKARQWYCFERDCDVERVGFLLRDNRRVGCSPDGLVGADGGLEIKTPSAPVHVGHLLGDLPDKYTCQIQGSLWITEREHWDFVSYNPELPPVLIRIDRDEKFITALASAVDRFLSFLDESKVKLAAKGLFPGFEAQPLRVVA